MVSPTSSLADGAPFGVAHHPERHRSDRLETDPDLMAQASISAIRAGEPAWSTGEPEDGTLDLERLAPVLDRTNPTATWCPACAPVTTTLPADAVEPVTGDTLPAGKELELGAWGCRVFVSEDPTSIGGAR
jgi:hypothetical protein